LTTIDASSTYWFCSLPIALKSDRHIEVDLPPASTTLFDSETGRIVLQ